MSVFTRTSPGAHDETTDTWSTPVVTTWSGPVMQRVSGTSQIFAELGLKLSTTVMLMIVPEDYNLRSFSTDFVRPGDTVDWNDEVYTVKQTIPVAPDGMIVLLYIIAVR